MSETFILRAECRKDDPNFHTVRMQCRSETANREKRTISAVISSEAPVRIFDWRACAECDEVLLHEGAQYRSQIPLQDSHDRSSVDSNMGSVRNVRRETPYHVGDLHFAADEKSQRTFAKYADGHMTDVSIGYRTYPAHTVRIQKGTESVLNGRAFRASSERDLLVRTKYDVREVSCVACGADPAAQTREEGGGQAAPGYFFDLTPGIVARG